MMTDALLQLYHFLPASTRSIVASLRGLYLRSWRYGPETERLVQEALDREHWSKERLRTWQEERLTYILHRAATRVPYYQHQWAQRRQRGDRKSFEYLEHWPVLGKESVRDNPTGFIADDSDTRYMFHEHTSGTTGKPLDLWWSDKTTKAWYALFELRCRHWYGVSRHDHWAILGGQPIIPPAEHRRFWVWNAPMRQLYLSANHINRRNAKAFMSALTDYGITHMVAYCSSASILAHAALELGISPPTGLKVVITNGEPLFPWQRSTIRQGFQSHVCQTYGMAEIVTGASECYHSTLHLWPEVGWLEVLDDVADKPLPYGISGRLVCTSLLNLDMPLVRYAVGDRGSINGDTHKCRCGRMLQAISGLEGRVNDLLITRDGRRVFWLNPIFYNLPIREAQIVQETVERIRVVYVPANNFSPNAERSIVERLLMRMGPVEVILEEVNEVPRETNGKFRAVISKIPAEQRAALRPTLQQT